MKLSCIILTTGVLAFATNAFAVDPELMKHGFCYAANVDRNADIIQPSLAPAHVWYLVYFRSDGAVNFAGREPDFQIANYAQISRTPTKHDDIYTIMTEVTLSNLEHSPPSSQYLWFRHLPVTLRVHGEAAELTIPLSVPVRLWGGAKTKTYHLTRAACQNEIFEQ